MNFWTFLLLLPIYTYCSLLLLPILITIDACLYWIAKQYVCCQTYTAWLHFLDCNAQQGCSSPKCACTHLENFFVVNGWRFLIFSHIQLPQVLLLEHSRHYVLSNGNQQHDCEREKYSSHLHKKQVECSLLYNFFREQQTSENKHIFIHSPLPM